MKKLRYTIALACLSISSIGVSHCTEPTNQEPCTGIESTTKTCFVECQTQDLQPYNCEPKPGMRDKKSYTTLTNGFAEKTRMAGEDCSTRYEGADCAQPSGGTCFKLPKPDCTTFAE